MANSRDELEQQPNMLLNAREVMDRATGELPVVEKEVVVADPNALIPQGSGTFVYKRFRMTPVGMEIPADVTGEEWEDVGFIIKSLESSISWVVGDWAAFANRMWSTPYAQIAEHFGYVEDTVKSYASVCRAVQRLIRNQRVDFSHHRLVMGLTAEKQRYWLDQAAANHWRLEDMRKAMSNRRLTPPKPKLSGDEKKLHDFADYIDTQRAHKSEMEAWQREEYAQCAQWLAEYYYREAQWGRGSDEYSSE